MMMGSLKFIGEISAERMLAAFKWLEEIPIAVQLQPVDSDHVDCIASCAAEVALRLGYDNWVDRIRGSLRVLRFESHRDRFTRLIKSIRHRLGTNIVDDLIVEHLMRATMFRGKVAHGIFEPKDEAERLDFIRATAALECFNYLLMVRDLPVSETGVERVRSSKLVSEYRLW
jgi:hypothetical protein